MVQSPSWEANWFAASQKIPCISRNPKVHCRTHKRTPPVSILGQPNPVYIPTSHLLEIHPNIIHPSTRRSPQWSLSLWFLHQDPTHSPLLTHTRNMPSPSHSSRLYHPILYLTFVIQTFVRSHLPQFSADFRCLMFDFINKKHKPLEDKKVAASTLKLQNAYVSSRLSWGESFFVPCLVNDGVE